MVTTIHPFRPKKNKKRTKKTTTTAKRSHRQIYGLTVLDKWSFVRISLVWLYEILLFLHCVQGHFPLLHKLYWILSVYSSVVDWGVIRMGFTQAGYKARRSRHHHLHLIQHRNVWCSSNRETGKMHVLISSSICSYF